MIADGEGYCGRDVQRYAEDDVRVLRMNLSGVYE